MSVKGKVAFYSHDTVGLGHLRRCLKMAAAITDCLGVQDGLIVTGSPWSGMLAPPAGFRFVSLPPVIKNGPASYSPRDPALSTGAVLAGRRAILARELLQFAPQLLVVDNVPCGLKGEILPVLPELRSGGTRIVLSLRDVLDDEAAIRAEWQAAGSFSALNRFYDEIWLFGDRHSATYQLIPAALYPRTILCGHLGDAHGFGRATARGAGVRPRILVTGGGGSDAGALVTTYVAAVRERRPWARHHVVLGPDFPGEELPDMAGLEELGITMARFEPDMANAIREADVVVSMAGYNTVCEVLAAGQPMVLVPRIWPRREQWLRATELADAGRAEVIHPHALDPSSLWQAVERALAGPPVAPAAQEGGRHVGQRALQLLTHPATPAAVGDYAGRSA